VEAPGLLAVLVEVSAVSEAEDSEVVELLVPGKNLGEARRNNLVLVS